MKDWIAAYSPLFSPIFSFITGIIGAFLGFKIAHSIETDKITASYLNYALQKLMDEYVKYDPVIDLSQLKYVENGNFFSIFEEKFKNCRAMILKILPLISKDKLIDLEKIDKWHTEILTNQYNLKIAGKENIPIEVQLYSEKITQYINIGHNILHAEIRARLEKGKISTP